MKARVVFDTAEYKRTHGRMPRGYGGWAFCPTDKYDDGNYLDHCFWAYGKTFAMARNDAAEHFEKLGIYRVTVCT